jgi:hypothetical protein
MTYDPSAKRRLAALLSGCLLLTLSGCDRDTPTDLDLEGLAFSQGSARSVQIIRSGEAAFLSSDPYRLMSMAIEGNELVLLVRYRGGCIVHDFRLLARDDFRAHTGIRSTVSGGSAGARFLPGFFGPPRPGLALILFHDARGDLCRERVHQELRFDLTAVRRHFETTFGTTGGEVILTLSSGWVRYRF